MTRAKNKDQKKIILVSGASGFIGTSLIPALLREGYITRCVIRNSTKNRLYFIKLELLWPETLETSFVDDVLDIGSWKKILEGVDVVINLLGRAHILREKEKDSLAAFRELNVEFTENLIKVSVKCKVRRFIYLSSIGVNGSNTNFLSFSEDDKPKPHNHYAVSKLEAECSLIQMAKDTCTEVVIIRPPLVYGPKAPGNFNRLINICSKGIPLPLGAIHNKRSFIALDNLVSFITHCIHHPKAANQVFLISDGDYVSTTQLLQKISRAFNRSPHLIPVPVSIMRFIAKLLGKEDMSNRLFDSLQIDSSKARDLLGWSPVVTMDEALKRIVDEY